MKKRRLKALLTEAPFLVLGTYLVYLLDPSLASALQSAASSSPADFAWLWSFLGVLVKLHVDVVIIWLGWLAAVLDAVSE